MRRMNLYEVGDLFVMRRPPFRMARIKLTDFDWVRIGVGLDPLAGDYFSVSLRRFSDKHIYEALQ